jgi:hypothetical protein
MRIYFFAEMFQDGRNRSGHHLAKATDGSKAQSVREFVEQSKIGGRILSASPSVKHLHQLARPHAAGHALAAGFVAIKFRGI